MKKMFFAAIVALFAVTTVSAQTPGNWAVGPKIGIYTNAGAEGAILVSAQPDFTVLRIIGE